MLSCIYKVRNSKELISQEIRNLLVMAVFCVFGNLIVLTAKNELTAKIGYGIYFSFIDFAIFYLYYFCKHYSNIKHDSKIVKYLFITFNIFDSISFFINIFKEHLFKVEEYKALERPLTFFNNFVSSAQNPNIIEHTFYNFIGSWCYNIHLFVCYFAAAISVIYLLWGYFSSPPLYKKKYSALILILIFIIFFDTLFLFVELPFDYSVILYSLIAIVTYYGAIVVIPKALITHTLSFVVDEMRNGLIIFDPYGKCIYLNEIIKKFLFGNNFKNSYEKIYEVIKNYGLDLSRNFAQKVEFDADENKMILKIRHKLITDKKNRFLGSYMTIQDLTEEEENLRIEHYKATRDKLTGIYNKDYFYEKAEKLLKERASEDYLLIVSDIVNFKIVNDLYGTAVGDDILVTAAYHLNQMTFDDDVYGRLHNDHFALIMPSARYNEQLFESGALQLFGVLDKYSYSLVCHIGVYHIDDKSIPVSLMCDRAFLALNTIKGDFKKRIAYYDDVLRSEAIKVQEFMNELPVALKFGELKMYLQAQADVNGKILGAEALVRWDHRTKGIITPSDFIQAIEAIGMIADIDKFVWEAACKKLSEWRRKGRDDLYISVNISPKDFYLLDIYEIFVTLIKKYNISPKNLNLEITETAIMMDFDRQMELIKKLRNYGFKIEMDDFGSGYSSLNMLKDIDVDVLKIDMAFLRKSENDAKSKIILENIIKLAKELGIKVITEGVENEEQKKFLTEAGCDFFQGYYYSKPITTLEFEEKFF